MDLVVIVPGSVAKSPRSLRWLFNKFYQYYGFDTKENDWTVSLKAYLEQISKLDVIVFNWSGGITEQRSLKPAADQLYQLLLQTTKYQKVIIFAKSLGGRVAELALEEMKQSNNIDKLIYIATPHKNIRNNKLKNIRIVNIYSEEDKYVDLANKVLYLGRGTKYLKDAENIILKALKHADFNKNNQIEYQGKTIDLFRLYQEKILQ